MNKVQEEFSEAVERLGNRSVSVLASFGEQGRTIGSLLDLFEKLTQPECMIVSFAKHQVLSGRVVKAFAIPVILTAPFMHFMNWVGMASVFALVFLTFAACFLETWILRRESKRNRVTVIIRNQIQKVTVALNTLYECAQIDSGEPPREFARKNLQLLALKVMEMEDLMRTGATGHERASASYWRLEYRKRLSSLMNACVSLTLADGNLTPYFEGAKRELGARQSKAVGA